MIRMTVLMEAANAFFPPLVMEYRYSGGMILNFLNFNEGRFEFINSPYLNQFNLEELKIRLGLMEDHPFAKRAVQSGKKAVMLRVLLNIYLDSCEDFSLEEQEAITFCFMYIDKLIKERTGGSFFVPNNFQVQFIKLNSGGRKLDWGYLFTINETIVLPDNYLDEFLATHRNFLQNARANGSPNFDMLGTHLTNFYHEVVHLLQRTPKSSGVYTKMFEHVYRKLWGFVKIDRHQLLGLSEGANFITNPDGFNYQWIVSLNGRGYFLPALTYDRRRRVPVGVLIELESLPDDRYRLTDRWDLIERFPAYTRRFYGLSGQLYHPNEIMAQLLSDYLIGNRIYADHPNYVDFYKYINRYMR